MSCNSAAREITLLVLSKKYFVAITPVSIRNFLNIFGRRVEICLTALCSDAYQGAAMAHQTGFPICHLKKNIPN